MRSFPVSAMRFILAASGFYSILSLSFFCDWPFLLKKKKRFTPLGYSWNSSTKYAPQGVAFYDEYE